MKAIEMKIGDTVRRIKGSHAGMNIGDTATIKDFDGSPDFYLIEYPHGHSIRNFELAEINWKKMIEEE